MKSVKWQATLYVLIASVGILSACGSNKQVTDIKPAATTETKQEDKTDSAKPVTISVATNVVGEQAKVLQTIADNFTKENPTIKVEFSAPGKDYENMMKLKWQVMIYRMFSLHMVGPKSDMDSIWLI